MSETLQIFSIIVLIFSAVIHEYSHGWMADKLGDPTARYMGRLTLNPLAHLDPLGSVIVPIVLLVTSGFMVGWAKPVPYNPYNLKDQKNGPALVGLAGPGSNLLIAIIFGIAIRIYMLQGSAIDDRVVMLFGVIVLYNIMLALFNLMPIPPLDGSKVLFHLMPYSMHSVREFLERNYLLLLIAFILFGFDYILVPLLVLSFEIVTGSSQLLIVILNS